jgi:hypothetical protein
MINALELMYIDILDFHQQAMKFFSGKRRYFIQWCSLALIVDNLVWTRFFKSMWKDFNTRFSGILKSLGRHKDLVECRANIAQYRRYQEDIADFKARLDETVANEQAKKKMVVKEWLAVGQQLQNDHQNFCRIRKECATTARWVLQHETIKHWMDTDIPNTPVVWMHGIPGAGQLCSCLRSCNSTDANQAKPSLLLLSSTSANSKRTPQRATSIVAREIRQAVLQSVYLRDSQTSS